MHRRRLPGRCSATRPRGRSLVGTPSYGPSGWFLCRRTIGASPRRRRPLPAVACSVVARSSVRVAPGVDARGSRAARPVAGRDHSHVLRRVLSRRRSWGFPIDPPPGCSRARVPRAFRRDMTRASAGARARRFRPRRAHVPLALRSTPGGLARGTGRPVWEKSLAGGDPNDPPANGRRDHGGSARLLGFAPAHDPRPPTFVFFGGRDPALGFSVLSQGCGRNGRVRPDRGRRR